MSNSKLVNENAIEYDILAIYGWWEFSVCLFAFLGLIGIWYHMGRRTKDFGQVWLALSVLCWSLSGIVEIYFASQHAVHTLDQSILSRDSSIYNGLRGIFSLLNSLFILLALPWFKYIPDQLSSIIKSNFWVLIVGIPFIFCLLPSIGTIVRVGQAGFIGELDMYYGIFTLFFLSVILWNSFRKRHLFILAYLSLISILITLVAQVYKLTELNINMTLLSAIFKTTLIMIFFALALSWVKEITEILEINLDKLRLKFKSGTVKNSYSLEISGFQNTGKKDIILSRSQYALLKKFSKARKERDGWLEIKPKSEKRPNKHYDINDHNEIKRLVHGMLDAIYGKQMWTKNQHELPLKSVLFENSEERERLIRICLNPKNITFES